MSWAFPVMMGIGFGLLLEPVLNVLYSQHLVFLIVFLGAGIIWLPAIYGLMHAGPRPEVGLAAILVLAVFWFVLGTSLDLYVWLTVSAVLIPVPLFFDGDSRA